MTIFSTKKESLSSNYNRFYSFLKNGEKGDIVIDKIRRNRKEYNYVRKLRKLND